jgi:hypothetical protein
VIIEPQPIRRPPQQHHHDGHQDSPIPDDIWQVRVTVQAPTRTHADDQAIGWAEVSAVIKTWSPEILAAFQTAYRDKLDSIETALDKGTHPLVLQKQAETRVGQAKEAVLAAFLHLAAEERAVRHVEKIQTAHHLRR